MSDVPTPEGGARLPEGLITARTAQLPVFGRGLKSNRGNLVVNPCFVLSLVQSQGLPVPDRSPGFSRVRTRVDCVQCVPLCTAVRIVGRYSGRGPVVELCLPACLTIYKPSNLHPFFSGCHICCRNLLHLVPPAVKVCSHSPPTTRDRACSKLSTTSCCSGFEVGLLSKERGLPASVPTNHRQTRPRAAIFFSPVPPSSLLAQTIPSTAREVFCCRSCCHHHQPHLTTPHPPSVHRLHPVLRPRWPILLAGFVHSPSPGASPCSFLPTRRVTCSLSPTRSSSDTGTICRSPPVRPADSATPTRSIFDDPAHGQNTLTIYACDDKPLKDSHIDFILA